jgi:hypothetical protein
MKGLAVVVLASGIAILAGHISVTQVLACDSSDCGSDPQPPPSPPTNPLRPSVLGTSGVVTSGVAGEGNALPVGAVLAGCDSSDCSSDPPPPPPKS